MSRPRLLDAFCCQGGAARGYQLTGFEVTGIDIAFQPNYCGDDFIWGDALDLLADVDFVRQFDAVHASPPCQFWSTITPDPSRHPKLIAPTRDLLRAAGVPYVIENVAGAMAELDNPIMLCGSSFGLQVRRHRWFESNVMLMSLGCRHELQGRPVGVYGDHPDSREFLRPDGTRRGAKATTVLEAQEAMGMPWADWQGLAEAIPPAFTEHIGTQLLEHLSRRSRAGSPYSGDQK